MTKTEEQTGPRPGRQRYDVVVIGGGAAGLSGALTLSRARRSVLVIDAGHPRNAPATHVHTYLTREGTPPGELLAIGRAEVTGYGGEIVTATAGAIRRRPDGDFDVTLEKIATVDDRGAPPTGTTAGNDAVREARTAPDDGAALLDGAAVSNGKPTSDGARTVVARRLLVATGLVDELPGISGLAERWGRDVLHCPYCHGWEVRDQAIGVVGTGPMSVHQALLWRQWSADVTYFTHTAPEPGPDEREQLAARGIPVVESRVAAVEVTGDRLTGVRLDDGRTIPRQALVVATRLTARADVLTTLGLTPADRLLGDHVIGTHIPADPTGATTVPGVWVAGNLADPLEQVIGAAWSGVRAAAAINSALITADTHHAVTTHRATASTP
ncbi:NAD(P)/FAD-dependent oxidoreductase [Sphaerisporangium aureirubrum]|uniref:NAD(P)/FAD-dependent oxidoreductase n=1 Tax=Sphaerisporangium aureirubrum TaxID=1544736 RepID=A0ABW1NQJ4_9ACTN